MITEKIKNKFITFFECWFTPRCLAECLFSDFDNLGEFQKEKLGSIRLYQIPFLSNEALIDFEGTAKLNNLTEKEEFELKKNVGDIYNLGARKYGKSLITLKLDMALSSLYEDKLWSAFYSIDEKRLRGVLEPVEQAMTYHPVFKAWKFKCTYSPHIVFSSKRNHWKMQGVNLTLKGKSPGDQFYQLHVSKLWGDEVSFETRSVYEKKKESFSELGVVMRLAGMTNFAKYSPIGETFYDGNNKEHVINYPQYVNPFWDDKERKDRIKTYGGENSLNFRIYVGGEIVEDGISAVDMERVEKCINRKLDIQKFDITKKNFKHFENLIFVNRPEKAERMFLAIDVADRSTSEITIFSEFEAKYEYLYNISLYGLTRKQHEKILFFLIKQIKCNIISIDCGDAFGRDIAEDLEDKYGKKHVVRYDGNFKVKIDIETDENNNYKREKNGNYIWREEFMSEWAFQHLLSLWYDQRLKMPSDPKLELQLMNVVAIRAKTSSRTRYPCTLPDDHLYDSFRVFSIAQWLKRDFIGKEEMDYEPPTGASSWSD